MEKQDRGRVPYANPRLRISALREVQDVAEQKQLHYERMAVKAEHSGHKRDASMHAARAMAWHSVAWGLRQKQSLLTAEAEAWEDRMVEDVLRREAAR